MAGGDLNARMFNSFLDGTKSAIEMAAVSNATGLTPAPDGLAFPPCGVDDLPRVLRPREAGGELHHAGQVEVISSLERDGRPVFRDLRWGVFVTFEAGSGYVERCFSQYGLVTDESGRYTATYKPFHLIGLELGDQRGLGRPARRAHRQAGRAGAPMRWPRPSGTSGPARCSTARGDHLVYGRLMPAAASLAAGALPIGLAHGVRLRREVKDGAVVRWEDVEVDEAAEAVRFRREMEAAGTRADHRPRSARASPMGTKTMLARFPMSTIDATFWGSWSYRSARRKLSTAGGRLEKRMSIA